MNQIEKKPKALSEKLTFTEKDKDLLRSLVINTTGDPLEAVANHYGFAVNTVKAALHKTGNEVYRDIFYNAKAQVTSANVKSLLKIAEGYYYTETETKYALKPMAEDYFNENILKIIDLCQKADFEGFTSLILEGMIDIESGEVKKTEKYEKPDQRAIKMGLETLESSTWDLEAKHKAIPVKKIVVTVQGEPQRKREVKADFVVEAK